MTAAFPPAVRRLVAVGGGLLGAIALAGCAPAASTAPAPAGDTTASAPAAAPSTSAATSEPGASSSAAASGLRDGTYTASGDYQYPNGTGTIEVTVTLADEKVGSVKVEPKAADPTARQYESQFASGIGAVVVGKPIAGLKVGAVSGSSLTGQGFEKALATIRKDAAA